MSRGTCFTYMAWGSVIDDGAIKASEKSLQLDGGYKSLTDAYVAGPQIRIQETDIVSFQVDIKKQGATLAELYARVEVSFDGNIWRPLIGRGTLGAVGVAPNQEYETEVLPVRQKYIIPGDGSGFHMDFGLRSNFCRIALRGDVTDAGSEVRVLAGV